MVVARGSASSGGKGSGQHMPRICRSVCRPRKRVSPMTTPSASGAAHRSTTALPGDRANGSGRHTRGTHSRTVIDGSLTVRNYRCELTIAPSVCRGAELVGIHASGPRARQYDRLAYRGSRTRKGAERASCSRVAPQPAGAYRQRPSASGAAPIRGGQVVYCRRCDFSSVNGASQRATHLAAAEDEGLQRTSKRDERRRPQAIYEFLFKRRFGRDQETSLRQRQAMRQLLHRQG